MYNYINIYVYIYIYKCIHIYIIVDINFSYSFLHGHAGDISVLQPGLVFFVEKHTHTPFMIRFSIVKINISIGNILVRIIELLNI